MSEVPDGRCRAQLGSKLLDERHLAHALITFRVNPAGTTEGTVMVVEGRLDIRIGPVRLRCPTRMLRKALSRWQGGRRPTS